MTPMSTFRAAREFSFVCLKVTAACPVCLPTAGRSAAACAGSVCSASRSPESLRAHSPSRGFRFSPPCLERARLRGKFPFLSLSCSRLSVGVTGRWRCDVTVLLLCDRHRSGSGASALLWTLISVQLDFGSDWVKTLIAPAGGGVSSAQQRGPGAPRAAQLRNTRTYGGGAGRSRCVVLTQIILKCVFTHYL